MLEQVEAQRTLLPFERLTLEKTPDRTCGPLQTQAHARATLMAGLVAAGDPSWSRLFLKDWTMWKGAISKELQPGKESGESFNRDPTPEQCVEECAVLFLRRKEQQGCDELTTTLILLLLHCCGGGRGEKNSSEVVPGEIGELRGRCSEIWVYF